MKKLWGKTILLFSGLLALAGITTAPAQANIYYEKQIAEVRQTTPVYLKLSVNSVNAQNSNMQIAGHWSHSSHESHASHASHYSSR